MARSYAASREFIVLRLRAGGWAAVGGVSEGVSERARRVVTTLADPFLLLAAGP